MAPLSYISYTTTEFWKQYIDSQPAATVSTENIRDYSDLQLSSLVIQACIRGPPQRLATQNLVENGWGRSATAPFQPANGKVVWIDRHGVNWWRRPRLCDMLRRNRQVNQLHETVLWKDDAVLIQCKIIKKHLKVTSNKNTSSQWVKNKRIHFSLLQSFTYIYDFCWPDNILNTCTSDYLYRNQKVFCNMYDSTEVNFWELSKQDTLLGTCPPCHQIHSVKSLWSGFDMFTLNRI